MLELVKGFIKGLGGPKQFLLSVFLFVLTVPYSTVSIGTLQGLQESVWFIQNFLLSVCIKWTPLYRLFEEGCLELYNADGIKNI